MKEKPLNYKLVRSSKPNLRNGAHTLITGILSIAVTSNNKSNKYYVLRIIHFNKFVERDL